MNLLSAITLWVARHISNNVPVVVIEAKEDLLQALDDFNNQLEADKDEDEKGSLR